SSRDAVIVAISISSPMLAGGAGFNPVRPFPAGSGPHPCTLPENGSAAAGRGSVWLVVDAALSCSRAGAKGSAAGPLQSRLRLLSCNRLHPCGFACLYRLGGR